MVDKFWLCLGQQGENGNPKQIQREINHTTLKRNENSENKYQNLTQKKFKTRKNSESHITSRNVL